MRELAEYKPRDFVDSTVVDGVTLPALEKKQLAPIVSALKSPRKLAKGAELIAKARGLRGLRSLRIVMNPIGSGGATALSAAKWAQRLL